jgi:hypothetical protein
MKFYNNGLRTANPSMVTGLTGPGGRRATVAVAGATSPEPERGMQSEDF